MSISAIDSPEKTEALRAQTAKAGLAAFFMASMQALKEAGEEVLVLNTDRFKALSESFGEPEFARLVCTHENETGEDLSPLAIEYNLHYWRTTREKGMKFAILRVDNPAQIFYESNQGTPEFMPGVNLPEVLASLITNYEEVAAQIRPQKAVMKQALQEGSLTICTNHSTWLNMPLLAVVLHKELEVPLSDMYTILGPALTTFEQGMQVACITNLIKTVPTTQNGRLDDIEGGATLQDSIRGGALSKMKEVGQSGPGKIFIVCPFGTSDDTTSVPGKFCLKMPPESSQKITRFLNNFGALAWIGTNDEDIFGDKIPKEGEMHLRVGDVHPKRSITKNNVKEGIYEMKDLVVDGAGNPAGEIVEVQSPQTPELFCTEDETDTPIYCVREGAAMSIVDHHGYYQKIKFCSEADAQKMMELRQMVGPLYGPAFFHEIKPQPGNAFLGITGDISVKFMLET